MQATIKMRPFQCRFYRLSCYIILTGLFFLQPRSCRADDQLSPLQVVRQVLKRPGSKISFGVKSPNPGLAMNGDFTGYSGVLSLDPRGLEHSVLELTLDLQSVRLPPDQVLQAVFLQTALSRVREPRPTFKSTSIRRNGPSRLNIDGSYTWNGKVRKATVPVQLVGSSATRTELRLALDGAVREEDASRELGSLAGASGASGWAKATLLFSR